MSHLPVDWIGLSFNNLVLLTPHPAARFSLWGTAQQTLSFGRRR